MSCNNDIAYEDVFKLGTKEAIVFAATAYILRNRKLSKNGFRKLSKNGFRKLSKNGFGELLTKFLRAVKLP